VRKLIAFVAIAAASSVPACKKTGPGEYEVQKPVIGTQTETVTTPTISVGTETTRVEVPKVTVKRDTAAMQIPTVRVNPAKKKY